jgi:hypothetical protein
VTNANDYKHMDPTQARKKLALMIAEQVYYCPRSFVVLDEVRLHSLEFDMTYVYHLLLEMQIWNCY